MTPLHAIHFQPVYHVTIERNPDGSVIFWCRHRNDHASQQRQSFAWANDPFRGDPALFAWAQRCAAHGSRQYFTIADHLRTAVMEVA